jgi:SAM-dependent methyltransferase
MSFPLRNCPLCGSINHVQAYLSKDRHYGIPGLYRIVRCCGCTLLFLNPMYSDQELAELYPTDYYAYQDNFPRNRWKSIVRGLLGYRVGTRDPEFSKPGKMLDLGCGSGWFIANMRNQGWQTHGVEISSAAADLGRKNAGLDIFSGTLEQAAFPSESFDYVRSNHSFEHISTPNETLAEIRRILKPAGKLLVGVPNDASLTSRVFGQYWWYRGAPVHPFTYSVSTLTALLKKHHFAVEKIVYNSDAWGILGSFQIWLNRKNGRRSNEGMVSRNRLLNVLCYWVARMIDLFQLGDEIEVTAVKSHD